MLRLDLIEKAVKEQIEIEQKNIVQTTNYLNKPLYYSAEPVTKSVATNKGTINPRELLGTKIVFPSDEAAKDGGYLIYLSPSFVQGKTVYKLFDKQSSEQRRNTVKVKESNLDKYIYQVDPNGDPSQKTTEDGEEIPQVDNLDKAVTRNREQTISPKTEVETDEEYQARFMEEYHDLVRDINGELREIDPEMARKQLVARAKEKELEIKQKEVEQLETNLIGVLGSEEQCVVSYPNSTKSILNFKTIIKSQSTAPECGSEIEKFIDAELTGISQDVKDKLKTALKNKKFSLEELRTLKKEFEFIKKNLYIYADTDDQLLIREQLCAIMLLDLIDPVNYDNPKEPLEQLYEEFYDNYIGSYGLAEMGLRVKERDLAMAAIVEIAPDAPNKYQRVRTLIDTLKYLARLPNKEAVKQALKADSAKPNVFSHEAGNFIAAFLGLRNATESSTVTFPSYLGTDLGFTPVSPEKSLEALEDAANEELKEKIAAEKYEAIDFKKLDFKTIFEYLNVKNSKDLELLEILVKLREKNISNKDLEQIRQKLIELKIINENAPFNYELAKNYIVASFGRKKFAYVAKILAKIENENDAKEALKPKASANSPAYDAYKAAEEAQRIKNLEKLGALTGITEHLSDASLRELFDDLVIFNSDNERTKIILSTIADNLLAKVGCSNDEEKDKCKQLKAAIIHYLSMTRDVLHNQSSINTPLGEFFESLITLEILNKILTNNEIDPKSFSYNNKKGIEALTEYLKCTSNNNSKVLKPMDSLFSNSVIDSASGTPTPPKGYELSEVPADHPGAETINKVKTILEDENFRKKVLGDSDSAALETLSKEIFTLENAEKLSDKDKTELEEKKQKRNALRENLIKAAFLYLERTPISDQKKAVSFFYNNQTYDDVLKNIDTYTTPLSGSTAPVKRKNREDLQYAMKSLAKDAIEEEEKIEDAEQSPQTNTGNTLLEIPQVNSGNILTGSPQPVMTEKQKRIATNIAIKSVVTAYSNSVSEKDKGRKIADFEGQLKKGNYTLDESGNITVFDNKGQAISTVKVEPTNLPHLPAQTKLQPTSKSFLYFYSLKDFLVLKSVKSKTENCPKLDPNNPNDSNNAKAFLRVNCKDGKGVYYIGFSKAAGIDGSEAGFGDVAFFKANNVILDENGKLKRVNDSLPMTLEFQIFEGKLVKNRGQKVNFNAFGRFNGCAGMAIRQIESLRKKDPSGKIIEPRLEAKFQVFKYQGSLGDISISAAEAGVQDKEIGSMAGKFVLNFREDTPLRHGKNLAGILNNYSQLAGSLSYMHRHGEYVKWAMKGMRRGKTLDNLLAYVEPNGYALGSEGKFSVSRKDKDVLIRSLSNLEKRDILTSYKTADEFIDGLIDELATQGLNLDLDSKRTYSDGTFTLRERLTNYYESLKTQKDHKFTEEEKIAIDAMKKITKAFSLQDLPELKGKTLDTVAPKKDVDYTLPGRVYGDVEDYRKRKTGDTTIDEAKEKMFSLLGIDILSQDQSTRDTQISTMLTMNRSLITSDEFNPLLPSLVAQIEIAKKENPNANSAEIFAIAFSSEAFQESIKTENKKREIERQALFAEGNSTLKTLGEDKLKTLEKFGSVRALALIHLFSTSTKAKNDENEELYI